MKKEPIDSWLEPLDNLQQVETPAGMSDRIHRTIAIRQQEWTPPRKVLLAGIAFCLLLAMNTLVVLKQNSSPEKNESRLNGFGLLTDNDFYK